jgi:WD40 repeat protein
MVNVWDTEARDRPPCVHSFFEVSAEPCLVSFELDFGSKLRRAKLRRKLGSVEHVYSASFLSLSLPSQHSDYVKVLAYSPSTKCLVSAGLDRHIAMYSLDSLKPISWMDEDGNSSSHIVSPEVWLVVS